MITQYLHVVKELSGLSAISIWYRRGFWIVFTAGFLLRLLYLFSGAVELAPDETYYWQWSRNLDWCYYSKGPLVAYLIYLGTLVGGDTPFGVRLPTVLLSALTLCISYLLYKKLYPRDDLGLFLMALFYHSIPLMLVGSIIATIDPPLCAAWIVCTWALYNAAHDNRPWGWWILGLSLGIGILAKYTMLLYVPAIFMYFVFSPKNRHWLTRPHPYLAVTGGLVFLTPLIIWNINHDWVSLHHTAALGKIGQSTFHVFNLKYLFKTIVMQAIIVSPILFFLLLAGLAAHVRKSFSYPIQEGSLLLVCSIAPVLLLYSILAFKRSINPNWLATLYPGLIVMGASTWSEKVQQRRGVLLVGGGVLLGMMLCFVLMFSDAIHALDLPQSEKWDPSARLKGWKEFSELAQRTQAEFESDTPVFFFGSNYQTASELAFYLPNHPRTYCASSHPLSNQYDMWGGSKNLIGLHGVYMDSARKRENFSVPDQIASSFERVETAGEGTVSRSGKIIRYHKAWRCYGFRGWTKETEFRPGDTNVQKGSK